MFLYCHIWPKITSNVPNVLSISDNLNNDVKDQFHPFFLKTYYAFEDGEVTLAEYYMSV